MSKNDFGGIITGRSSTGLLLSLRGTLNLMNSSVSNEVISNQDGSNDRIMTPTARRAEMSFVDRGEDLDALMKGDRFDFTYVEKDTSVSHYYTSCFVIGEPSINRLNGEVSGLTLVADSYNRKG